MTHRLLLIDGSAAIRRVVELTFADTEVEVVAVEGGEAALHTIRERAPDICVADIGTLRRGGYQVAMLIEADPSGQLPVLLLAGAFEPEDESVIGAPRSRGVLVKPFEPEHLAERVREVLRDEPEVPTVDSVLGAREPKSEIATEGRHPLGELTRDPLAAAPPPEEGVPRQPMADAFGALLATDEEAGASHDWWHRRDDRDDVETTLSQVQIDSIVERVRAELQTALGADLATLVREAAHQHIADVLKQVVADAQGQIAETVDRVVPDVSERLVREEIARVRRQSTS